MDERECAVGNIENINLLYALSALPPIIQPM